ncbi:transposase [Nocardia brevicatena]|uniref:transposase n=1 Tax=Nocardia brevicatena TaxID=37327 RepID=UPI00278C83D8|nr:transposase [Nocardia brevicatena]
MGYPGTEQQVQRYLRRFRTRTGHMPVPAPRPPSVRDMPRWIMTDPANLTTDDSTRLRRLGKRSKDLRRLANHVEDFAVMTTRLEGQCLEEWISIVEKDTLTAIASFARNLRRDIDAVRNGLTLPYSSGPVEGHIKRIKIDQTPNVRPGQPGPPPQTHPATELITKTAPEPRSATVRSPTDPSMSRWQ